MTGSPRSPGRTGRTGRRARVVLVGVLAFSGAAGALAATPTARSGMSICRYPGDDPTDQWVRLSTPGGAPLATVDQLDQDPCVLVGADASGARWRSTNGGERWAAFPEAPWLRRVLAEGLQPRAGADGLGPVLAVGSAQRGSGAGDQVYVSDDDGQSFVPATVTYAAAPVAVPEPAGQATGLRMDVRAAATAVRYVGGTAAAYVYAAGRVTSPLLSGRPVDGVASLLKSTDGGRSFTPLDSARQLAVTAIAVNPTSPDEIWVNDQRATGGGAWVSYDGGQSFSSACCPQASVNDITVTAAPDGGIVVLLATAAGLLRSVDDGASWQTIADGAVTGVRTPADDPTTILAQTDSGVQLSTGDVARFKPLPGLPADCGPRQLRSNDRVPTTFLVDCASGTFRLMLTKYTGGAVRSGGAPVVPTPTGPVGAGDVTGTGRPLTELARWSLPGSNTSTGTIAFDGKVLYYDLNSPGAIGRVRAADGKTLQTWRTDLAVVSLTVDLRANRLIVTVATGGLYALDLDTGKQTWLGVPPTKVPSYDSFSGGLSWVPEFSWTLWRRPIAGTGRGQQVCTVSGSNFTGVTTTAGAPSTFVAAGDGGGYIQMEDDASLSRIDNNCRVVGNYTHRVFSESSAENDAMACDTQSYFPQPAIWIRDSQPQTVTAYGVPFGYCPMPSRLALEVPSQVVAGSVTSLCAVLVNATNGDPAANRGIEMSVSGTVAGHGQTDAAGRACVPYVPAGGLVGRRDLAVSARFAGDSALYPSSARGVLGVLDALAPPAVPNQVAVVVPPPVPPAPAVPPNPVPNPGPAGAPAQAPVPNAANAPAGQIQANAQPVAQGVVVPQRQQQPQLALARAARQAGLENSQMVAPSQPRRRLPVDGPAAVAVLGIACVVTAAAIRPAAACARPPSRRPCARGSGPSRWR